VYENKVFRKISGTKMDEVIGQFRALRYEEHRDLYMLPSVLTIVESNRMR
jgi:hypothetical protein